MGECKGSGRSQQWVRVGNIGAAVPVTLCGLGGAYEHGGSYGAEDEQAPHKQQTDALRDSAPQPTLASEHTRVRRVMCLATLPGLYSVCVRCYGAPKRKRDTCVDVPAPPC